MTLTVINPRGLGVMQTSSIKCFPSRTELNQMSAGGFKFTLDGKRVGVRELIRILDESKMR